MILPTSQPLTGATSLAALRWAVWSAIAAVVTLANWCAALFASDEIAAWSAAGARFPTAVELLFLIGPVLFSGPAALALGILALRKLDSVSSPLGEALGVFAVCVGTLFSLPLATMALGLFVLVFFLFVQVLAAA